MDPRPLIAFALFGILPSGKASEVFSLAEPPPEWEAVLEPLIVRCPMAAEFSEYRRNPFHRNERRFAGTIRWAPELGLSIGYVQPAETVIQIGRNAVFVAREGAVERMRAGADQQELMLLFAKLFEWDRAWLAERFQARGQLHPEDGWRLYLSPRESVMARALSSILLEGGDGRLKRILVGLPGGRSVEIRLAEPEFFREFPEEVIRTAFPASDE